MARTVTLTELIAEFRQRGDYSRSSVFSDATITDYLNRAWAKVYALLVSKWADYALVETTVATTANSDTVSLPAAFWKLRALDLRSGTAPNFTYATCRRFELAERNRYGRAFDSLEGPAYYYRMESGDPVNSGSAPHKLRLTPMPTAVDTLRLFYIPVPTQMTTGADTIDTMGDYDDLVIERALLYADMREERPLQERLALIQRLEQELHSSSDGRDSSEPTYLADLDTRGW